MDRKSGIEILKGWMVSVGNIEGDGYVWTYEEDDVYIYYMAKDDKLTVAYTDSDNRVFITFDKFNKIETTSTYCSYHVKEEIMLCGEFSTGTNKFIETACSTNNARERCVLYMGLNIGLISLAQIINKRIGGLLLSDIGIDTGIIEYRGDISNY